MNENTHIETGIPDLDKKLKGGYSTEDHPPHEHTGHMNCCQVVHIKAEHAEGDMRLQFGRYGNGRLAISLVDMDGMPEYKATVNVVDAEVPAGHVLLRGWDDNAGLPEALVKAGVVELTDTLVPAGYCVAHLAKVLVEIP